MTQLEISSSGSIEKTQTPSETGGEAQLPSLGDVSAIQNPASQEVTSGVSSMNLTSGLNGINRDINQINKTGNSVMSIFQTIRKIEGQFTPQNRNNNRNLDQQETMDVRKFDTLWDRVNKEKELIWNKKDTSPLTIAAWAESRSEALQKCYNALNQEHKTEKLQEYSNTQNRLHSWYKDDPRYSGTDYRPNSTSNSKYNTPSTVRPTQQRMPNRSSSYRLESESAPLQDIIDDSPAMNIEASSKGSSYSSLESQSNETSNSLFEKSALLPFNPYMNSLN